VRGAGALPGLVARRRDAGVARLRHGVERPDGAAALRVERPDVSRRILRIRESVGNAVADDHEVPENDGRRGVRVLAGIDLPLQSVDETDDAFRAEGVDRPTRLPV